MPSEADLLQSLVIAMLDRAEQGGEDVGTDLEKLAKLADQPEQLQAMVGGGKANSKLTNTLPKRK